MASIDIPPVPDGIPLVNITETTDIDILNGRDGFVQRHQGNQNYRKLVNANKEAYIKCQKKDKLRLSRCIVAAVRERGGRFLEKAKGSNVWNDIGDKKAVEKTSQALREGQPKIKQRMAKLGNTSTAALGSGVLNFTGTKEFPAPSTVSWSSSLSTGTPLETIDASPLGPEIGASAVVLPVEGLAQAISEPPLATLAKSPQEMTDTEPAAVYQRSTTQQRDDLYSNNKNNTMSSISEEFPYAAKESMHQSHLFNCTFGTDTVQIQQTTPVEFTFQQQPSQEQLQREDYHHRQYDNRQSPSVWAYNHDEYPPVGFHPPMNHYHIPPPAAALAAATIPSYDQAQPPHYQETQPNQFPPPQYYQKPPQYRDVFDPPTRSKSAESMGSIGSLIFAPGEGARGRPPMDMTDASTTMTHSNGTAGSSRQLDRRRMFAKMKASRPSTSRRSEDGMPDICMVDSNFSLLSIGGNSRAGTPTTAAAAGSTAMSAGDAQGMVWNSRQALSKDDMFYVALSSRRSLTMFRDDTYPVAMGSRRSLMSGISNVSGTLDIDTTVFSDVSQRKTGNASIRSIAMSEISGVEQDVVDIDGLVDWE